VQQINGRKTLVVVGSEFADGVSVNKNSAGYLVHATFLAKARTIFASGIQQIEMALLSGNDSASISGSIAIPAIIDGGSGDDDMNGGGGNNIIIGGAGSDKLSGGGVRDILIGGADADRIVGNGGDDILIAGATSYDSGPDDDKLANDGILLKLADEWFSTRSYSDRVANIQNGTGPILGGTGRSLTFGATVFSDTAIDQLTGSSGSDWFFFDVATDKATDLSGSETTN
ncbi:MAG: hypothetical protein ACREJC_06570, partial [Tepidisphaeraceae bacterium]